MAGRRSIFPTYRGGGWRGRGRVQRAARRAFLTGDVVATADIARTLFARRLLLHGRRLYPDHYKHVRKVLSVIATPIGRVPGRSLLWRLKDPEKGD